MIVRGVEFHDLPLTGIEFSFEKGEIVLTVKPWSEEMNAYWSGKVQFKGVDKINLGLMEISDINDLEVTSMDIMEGESMKVTIIILNGWENASTELAFECNGIDYSW